MTKEEVITHLRKLGNGEILPKNLCYGICHELFMLGYRVREFGDLLSDDYPVQHPTKNAGIAYSQIYNLWEDDSNIEDNIYRQNRRDLCLKLADYLENEHDQST